MISNKIEYNDVKFNIEFFIAYHENYVSGPIDRISACMLDKQLVEEYFDYYKEKHMSHNHNKNVYNRYIYLHFFLNFIIEKYYCNLPSHPYCHKCYALGDSKNLRKLFHRYSVMGNKFYNILFKEKKLYKHRSYLDIICKYPKRCFHSFIDKDEIIDMTGKLALLELVK